MAQHPQLDDLIRRAAAGEAGMDPDTIAASRRWDRLLVYRDMGGWLLMSRDGEVWSLDPDEDVAPTPADDIWRIVATVVAARRWPGLAALLPARRERDLDCAACGGRGHLTDFEILCGVCGGLGWVKAVTAAT